MEPNTKNLFDVAFGIASLIGAIVAFILSLRQWRQGQAWQRAQKLDELITKWESDELLRLDANVLDWSSRDVTFRSAPFRIDNDEALLALRVHSTIVAGADKPSMFPGGQATLRDAYDALLSFFQRLEVAISGGLIDPVAASGFFRYWLERWVHFDRHRDRNNVLNGLAPATMTAGYVQAYGSPASFARLVKAFGLDGE